MRIALDALGGDHAPVETIAGAVLAVTQGDLTADELVLVGDRERIAAELARDENRGVPGFEIVHAPENIGMDEHPAQALRRKRNSSIVVGARLLKEKSVAGFVSAGNTGAMVGAATLLVGVLPRVRRPGIAVTFTTAGGPCTLIDVGANIHCQPEDLFVYGEMASCYMQGVLGIERPRVGLLNIGEEDGKGVPLVKETRDLFEASSLNFIGNVEGTDVFAGRADVVVCEGFVGNVVLKVSEGLGAFMVELFSGAMMKHPELNASGAGGAPPVWKQVARTVMKKTDYAEYGGAPLLGVDGSVLICHGRSDRRAIANALKVAKQSVVADVNQHIVKGLAAESRLDDRVEPGAGRDVAPGIPS
jgi:glycerol-3-phosphate acyltransferase PlsX